MTGVALVVVVVARAPKSPRDLDSPLTFDKAPSLQGMLCYEPYRER
jgi:hypothetical protein